MINQRDPEIVEIARQYLRVYRNFTITVVTVSEIVEGLIRAGDTGRLSYFLELTGGYEILPIEAEEAILAGRILGELAQTGQKIGDLDPFIAAVAITNSLPLVTNNGRHYGRIVDLGFDLELENWRGAP